MKKLGEFQNIRRALSQRRQLQIDDVQPEQKILAELALTHSFGKIPVGGRQNADVHRHRAGAADPVDHPLLDRAQKLGLQAHIHFRNLVEQQSAAVSLLELADPARHGTRESTLFVPEQLGFQEVFGNGGAVDRNERLRRPVGAFVNVAGDDFLARSRFPCDQHGRFRGSHLFGQLDHDSHGIVPVDQVAPFLGNGRQHGSDHFRVGRQGNVFLGTGPNGGDGSLRIRFHATGNHRDMHPFVLELLDQSRDIEMDFDHQQIGTTPGPEHSQRALDIVGMGHLRPALHGNLRSGCQLTAEGSDY